MLLIPILLLLLLLHFLNPSSLLSAYTRTLNRFDFRCESAIVNQSSYYISLEVVFSYIGIVIDIYKYK